MCSVSNFLRLVAQIEPCGGDDGMTPGMSIEVNVGQIWNLNLDMVFLENSTVPLQGVDNTYMEVTVQQMDSGIIFGVRQLSLIKWLAVEGKMTEEFILVPDCSSDQQSKRLIFIGGARALPPVPVPIPLATRG